MIGLPIPPSLDVGPPMVDSFHVGAFILGFIVGSIITIIVMKLEKGGGGGRKPPPPPPPDDDPGPAWPGGVPDTMPPWWAYHYDDVREKVPA